MPRELAASAAHTVRGLGCTAVSTCQRTPPLPGTDPAAQCILLGGTAAAVMSLPPAALAAHDFGMIGLALLAAAAAATASGGSGHRARIKAELVGRWAGGERGDRRGSGRAGRGSLSRHCTPEIARRACVRANVCPVSDPYHVCQREEIGRNVSPRTRICVAPRRRLP